MKDLKQMAFQTVREELENPDRSAFLLASCGMKDVQVQDADLILQGLQQLQRVRGRGTLRNELLMDPLFPVAVFHPTFKLDDRFALASCMIRAAEVDATPTPISLQRRQFQAVLTDKEPSKSVPPAEGVKGLARNSIAEARVTGWEADVWFFGSEGKQFVQFWTSIHPSTLPILTLETDETITAVLFFGLQGILSCLKDMCEEIDNTLKEKGVKKEDMTEEERKTSLKNILQLIRKEFVDVVNAAAFLPRPLENFADGFEIMLQDCWTWSEHLRLASDGAVDVDEFQLSVGAASTARHEFIQAVRKLRRAAQAWTQDPAASTTADKTLLDCCTLAMQAFERLNRSAGSIEVPGVPNESLRGLQMKLQATVTVLQRPFRGTLVPSTAGAPVLSGGSANQLSSVTMQAVEGRVKCWKELEDWFQSLPPTRGAGIAFLRNDTVLLPLDSHGRPKDKWLGGKVEAGETWWDAACREVDEETFVRSDPWVHRITKSHKGDTRRVLVDGEEMPWKPMKNCPLGSVLMARSNGVQLERDVEVPFSRARLCTRDVLAQAFDALPPSTQAKVVKSMRVALEENGSKSYRTLLLPTALLETTGRMPSVMNIPQAFKAHAKEIEMCCKPCFDDVFADEPLDVDWRAMQNWEEDGFGWISISDTGPRIRNVMTS
jgi:hypothetical protein